MVLSFLFFCTLLRRCFSIVRKYLEATSWVLTSLILFTAAIGVPFTSPFTLMVAPVPFFVITEKAGSRAAAAAFILALPAVFFIGALPGVVVYTAMFSLTGIACSLLSRTTHSIYEYGTRALAVSLFGKLFLFAVSVIFFEYNPFVITPEMAAEVEEIVKSLALESGRAIDTTGFASYAAYVSETLSVMMPTMLIIFSLLETFFSYKLLGFIFRKTPAIKLHFIPPFGEWKCPPTIFSALIASFVIELLAKASQENSLFTVLAVNLMEVTRFILVIEGLSVMWYFMGRKRVYKFFRSLIIMFTIIFTPLSYVMSMLGIFDIWYDLRKGKRERKDIDEGYFDKGCK